MEIFHVFQLTARMSKVRKVPPGLTNLPPPGSAKLAKAPPPGLTRRANAPQLPGGGWGWAQLELTNALCYENINVSAKQRKEITKL